MRLPLLTIAPWPVCTLAIAACDKDDSKSPAPAALSTAAAAPNASAAAAAPPPSASAAPAASASTAAAGPPSPACPAGLTGDSVPAFCIKLPASYHVKDARITPQRGSIAYDMGAETDNLMVSYDFYSIAEQAKDVASEMKFGSDKLEKKGDLLGGNKCSKGRTRTTSAWSHW